jgi:hypothetical protein
VACGGAGTYHLPVGTGPSIWRSLTGVAVLALVGGCGQRAVAYHFRAPLVGSVNASVLEDRRVASEPLPSRRRRSGGDPTLLAGAPRSAGTAPTRPTRLAIPSDSLRGGASGDDLAAALRHLVGGRDEESSHVRFAVSALRTVGARVDRGLAGVDDGPALRTLAEQRGALVPSGEGAPTTTPRLGDLLLFDRTTGDQPSSLVAVVVSVDSRAVIEFVYLARGVVRRGFAAPARPSEKRDEHGRVLNTHLRHNDGGDPRGTPSLAGQLHAAQIRLDRLLR